MPTRFPGGVAASSWDVGTSCFTRSMTAPSQPTHIAVVALVNNGRMLLVHRHPSRENYPDCWDLPGGHVEPGESADSAARRECLEELAIQIDDATPFPMACSNPTLRKHAFLATNWVGTPVNAAPDEHDALGWFTSDELPTLHLADSAALPDLLNALRTAG